LVAETVFLFVALPETRGKGSKVAVSKNTTVATNGNGKSNGHHGNGAFSDVNTAPSNGNGHSSKLSRQESIDQRLDLLKALRKLHFLFLGIFSGVEFTLTFLTFDRELDILCAMFQF
jgi:hypothetical protein